MSGVQGLGLPVCSPAGASTQKRVSPGEAPISLLAARGACCRHSYLVTITRSDTLGGSYTPVAAAAGAWSNRELKVSSAAVDFSNSILKVARAGAGTLADPYVYTYTINLINDGAPTTADGFYKAEVTTIYDDAFTETPVPMAAVEILSETIKGFAGGADGGTDPPTLERGLFPAGSTTILTTFKTYVAPAAEIGSGDL
jgi:hypothetical protein